MLVDTGRVTFQKETIDYKARHIKKPHSSYIEECIVLSVDRIIEISTSDSCTVDKYNTKTESNMKIFINTHRGMLRCLSSDDALISTNES